MDGQIRRLLETMKLKSNLDLGLISLESSCSHHVTLFQVSKQMASASNACGECSMDAELQALLALLALLAAVVLFNYAFYNTTTAYMHRRRAII